MIHKEDIEYYADGENAYEMIKYFDPEEEAKKKEEAKSHETVQTKSWKKGNQI